MFLRQSSACWSDILLVGHVAEKVVGQHDILCSEFIAERWGTGVGDSPGNAVPEPVLHSQGISLAGEQPLVGGLRHPFHFPDAERIDASDGPLYTRLRDVDTHHRDLEVRPRRSDHPERRIEFGPRAASEHGHFQARTIIHFKHEIPEYLELGQVPKKMGVVGKRLSSLDSAGPTMHPLADGLHDSP